jgi:transposase
MRKASRVAKTKKKATAAAGRAASNKAMEESISKLGDMSVVHKIAAGLDVHKESTTATIMGLDDVPGGYDTRKFGTLKKDIDAMKDWLLERKVGKVIMESTGIYWAEAFHRLSEAGLNVGVGNAREIKNVPGRKTDIGDSRWLANLARFDLIRHSRILPSEQEEVRELARMRQNYVEERSQHKNIIERALVKNGFNVSQIVTDVFGKTGMVIVNGLLAGDRPEDIIKSIECALGWRLKTPRQKLLDAVTGTMSEQLKFRIKMEVEMLALLDERIAELEDKLERELLALGHEQDIMLLETLPGVSRISALIILAELGGDVSGFRSAKALTSWAGLSPGNNESGGKRRSGKTMHGNARLKRVFCEVGWAAAARTNNCYFKDKWASIRFRLGFKKAIVAIGSKILQVIYHMLIRKEPYNDPNVNLEELMVKKNASKWMRRIKKYYELNFELV